MFGDAAVEDCVLAGALASKAENEDAIDLAVIGGLEDPAVLEGYTQSAFVPFDPVGKRTEATIAAKDGQAFKVTKGAPQVIAELERARRATAAKAERGGR